MSAVWAQGRRLWHPIVRAHGLGEGQYVLPFVYGDGALLFAEGIGDLFEGEAELTGVWWLCRW
ncbi:MAG TPA: hypothetical protein VMU51_21275 [Mycobacteriales bacterium]|nr:hypothetical protein [Mycobacteriales bacterium]